MSNYSSANTTSQRFSSRYPGSRINPDKVVLHTTEGTSWPAYGGGASAPHYTARPSWGQKRLVWRAHFPDEMNSRALVNSSGGVETNTDGAVQVELIGTCDPTHRTSWNGARAGRDYIYWPDAPDWALRDVGRFLADMKRRHGIPLEAPAFKAYPGSYGNSSARMSFAQWRSFEGVCGHQHVPENHHGDPGDIDVEAMIRHAGGKWSAPAEPAPAEPAPAKAAPKAGRAPKFPLPAGAYFGPKSGPDSSVSGYYSHRADLKKWQRRMAARGWSIDADGLYGPQTAKVARAFQSEKGLSVDGLIGARTWAAAWTADVT